MATILVIDDEQSIRGLLKGVLEKAGHRVLEAEDGRKGLTLYQKEHVDLVIMDLLMPETDGLEATLQLRATITSSVWQSFSALARHLKSLSISTNCLMP
jgi:CheY-like chemotaxis protein